MREVREQGSHEAGAKVVAPRGVRHVARGAGLAQGHVAAQGQAAGRGEQVALGAVPRDLALPVVLHDDNHLRGRLLHGVARLHLGVALGGVALGGVALLLRVAL